MKDSGNKMNIDFAKKNEKIDHCGCASRLKIAIFVGSFQFSSRFISIDPWKFTNFITGKDQFIFLMILMQHTVQCWKISDVLFACCLLILWCFLKKAQPSATFSYPPQISCVRLIIPTCSVLMCRWTILQMNYTPNFLANYF